MERPALRRWHFTNTDALARFFWHVSGLLLTGEKPAVEFISEKRSLDQNAMVWALYKQIADQLDDQNTLDVTRHCKLHYGVPILRAGSLIFRDLYDRVVKPHDHETKLAIMDWLPVSSKMDKSQCTEYIDTIIREYSKQGLSLVHPSETYDSGP